MTPAEIMWASLATCAILYGAALVFLAACWAWETYLDRAEDDAAVVRESRARRSEHATTNVKVVK